MKYINKFKLPKEIVNAITKDRYTVESEEPSDYSATKIIAPIQMTVLKDRYPDELRVRDVVDDFWKFMGSLAHNVLEEAWHESIGSKVEERLYTEVEGKTLSGKMDCYHNGEIRDYKTCKAYKIMKGGYDEWEKQLNIYAYLCLKNGWPVSSLKVIAIIFDWKEHEAKKDRYPECPFVVIPLRLWPIEETEAYITSRILSLEKAKEKTDERLSSCFSCSPAEQWCDVRDFAVLKRGAERATRTFDTLEEAEKYLEQMGKEKAKAYEIKKRMTERTRCLKWCDAAPVCLQHKRQCQEEGRNVEEQGEGCIF